jgi:molybdenum cofactor cytidylyltransferase
MRQRLDNYGVSVSIALCCLEEEALIANSLTYLYRTQPTAVIIASTTAPASPDDVVGRAIQRAGCNIERFLAPVEPGNLLLLAYRDEIPVVASPGCYRSAKKNVLDLLLPPLLSGYRVSGWELAAFGNGGLLV